jgi:hypothetical protein
MRRNPPPTGAKLGENVRQLVPQGTINFAWMLD